MPIQIVPPEQQALDTDKAAGGSTALDNVTLAQALAYLNANVTDLPTAKQFMVLLLKKLFLIDRRAKILETMLRQHITNSER